MMQVVFGCVSELLGNYLLVWMYQFDFKLMSVDICFGVFEFVVEEVGVVFLVIFIEY